jgi:hypothetical protein
MSYIFTGPINNYKGFVKNCAITASTLDMNNVKITSVADPTNPLDAVNLQTLNSYNNNVGSVNTYTITGTTPITISSATFGTYMVIVNGTTDGISGAIFNISKGSSSSTITTGNRLSNTGTGNLTLVWNAGEGIKLKKQSVSDDGVYSVKIF